jgi:hypothetical protein
VPPNTPNRQRRGGQSIPGHLRPIVRELRVAPSVDSGRCQDLCKVSRPTARTYLEELVLLGIATVLHKGNPQTCQPYVIALGAELSVAAAPADTLKTKC